jgi:hypothetical protein
MSETIWHITMSLDIAGPDGSMEWAGGHSDRPNLMADTARDATGAILAGRRWHDVAMAPYDGVAGIYGGRWSGPVFVLTRPPRRHARRRRQVPLRQHAEVRSRRRRPLPAAARSASSARASPPSAWTPTCSTRSSSTSPPVLLGDGARLFGGADAGRVALERIEQAASRQLSNLRFRVVA